MKDTEIVKAFVAYLRDNGYPGLRIDRRPEEENRESKDIEAIAGPFAIEHTSVDPLPNQRAQDVWFDQAMSGLENELSTPLYQLNISSEFGATTKEKKDRSAIRSALKAWLLQESPQLADGKYILDNVPGIPFRLIVTKLSNATPGIYFIRHLPVDNDKSPPSRIREQLDPKIEKLVPYKKCGFTTVLLIEGPNILNNPNNIREAFPNGLPSNLDEVWYVSTWDNEANDFDKLF